MSVFEFHADFTGVQAFGGGGGRVPKGVYAIQFSEAAVLPRNEKTGCTTVQIDWVVTEGEHTGGTIRDFIRLPDSNLADEDKRAKNNKNAIGAFKGILLSLGVPKEKLEGKLKLTEANLKGKTGYIDYTPKDESLGVQYDVKTYLGKAAYEAKLKALANAAEAVDTTGIEPEAAAPAKATKTTTAQRKAMAAQAQAAEPEEEVTPVAVANTADSDPLEFANI